MLKTNACACRLAKQELEREKTRSAAEGRKEQQTKIREMEKKLESLLRDFEYHAREAVNAMQDRAAAQKLSKDAERRIAKLRREFREQFDSTIVAHSTGADQGDPNAQPRLVKHVSEGDTVKLKSTGRSARIARKIDDNHFEVEIGAMKMKIARDDIAEVLVSAQARTDTPVKAARARGISVSLENEGGNMPSEINVIGRTVDEATAKLKSLSTALFSPACRASASCMAAAWESSAKLCAKYLQKHPHVSTVAEAPQNEGGGGATIAELNI